MSLDPELSPKAHQELELAAQSLLETFLKRLDEGDNVFDRAFGCGRVLSGSFEIEIERFGEDKSLEARIQRMEETLLIRVRQDRYTSICLVESIESNGEDLNLQLFAEHHSRIAYRFRSRIKAKRPGNHALGLPQKEDAPPRFFTENPWLRVI